MPPHVPKDSSSSRQRDKAHLGKPSNGGEGPASQGAVLRSCQVTRTGAVGIAIAQMTREAMERLRVIPCHHTAGNLSLSGPHLKALAHDAQVRRGLLCSRGWCGRRCRGGQRARGSSGVAQRSRSFAGCMRRRISGGNGAQRQRASVGGYSEQPRREVCPGTARWASFEVSEPNSSPASTPSLGRQRDPQPSWWSTSLHSIPSRARSPLLAGQM